MPRCATEGAALAALVRTGRCFCQQAQRNLPRTGPRRKPDIPDWVLALMIMVAVLRHKKTKSAQYAFWARRRADFRRWLPGQRLPARSTFFDRYRRVDRLLQEAIRLQGLHAIARGWADAHCVAVDKSLIAGLGPPWGPADRRRGHRPRGVDPDTTWGYSEHDGWVQGYAYEVVVSAPRRGVVWPLLASADTASRAEQRSLRDKIGQLPPPTRFVLADAGYDRNVLAEAVEWHTARRRTGRRFVCPPIPRPNDGRPRQPGSRQCRQRQYHRRLRERRVAFYRSARGRRRYARRKVTVEPFNAHRKHRFGLEEHVWHRGLGNNRTQLLAAIFGYQVLLTYNHRHGRPHAMLQALLDAL